MTKITVFGDSIAYGAWDSQGGWVDRLKRELDSRKQVKKMPRQFHLTYNFSISGATTKDLLKRCEIECAASRPDIIIFSIGGNDALYVKQLNGVLVKPEEVRKNVSELVKIAQNYTKKIIFLGLKRVDESATNPLIWDPNQSMQNKYLEANDEIIKKICLDEKVRYVSMDGLLKSADFEDGLHPNTQGHEKIYEKVLSEVEKLL
jgi:lysophospholipase L1-like esterase